MVLHRKELVDKLAEKTGMYKKDVKTFLDAFKELVYDELKEGNEIAIRYLLIIRPLVIEDRDWYNPRTKQWEFIEAHRTVKMIPSEMLKREILQHDKDKTD